MVTGHETRLTIVKAEVKEVNSSSGKQRLIMDCLRKAFVVIKGYFESRHVTLPGKWDTTLSMCKFCNNVFGTFFRVEDAKYDPVERCLKVKDRLGNTVEVVMCEVDEDGF